MEQGRDLDFDLFPFQIEMHGAFGDRDQRHVAVMKSGQCGISALGVSLALYAGDVWGANVLYVLPTGDDAYDFSDTRVKPAIDDAFYLRTRVASTRAGRRRIVWCRPGLGRLQPGGASQPLALSPTTKAWTQTQDPKLVRAIRAAFCSHRGPCARLTRSERRGSS